MFLLEHKGVESVDVCKSVCNMDSVFNTDFEFNMEITDRIGIPLIFCYIPHAPSWRGRLVKSLPAQANLGPRLLDLSKAMGLYEIQPLSPDYVITAKYFATADKEVRDSVDGSIIAVRKDGKPLTPLLVRCHQLFTQDMAGKAAHSGFIGKMHKDKVLACITKADWEKSYKAHIEACQAEPDFDPIELEDFLPA